MIKLVARICKINSIAHYWDSEYIFVNKDNISSIAPDGRGFYLLTMKSGENFTLNMTESEITKAMEEQE